MFYPHCITFWMNWDEHLQKPPASIDLKRGFWPVTSRHYTSGAIFLSNSIANYFPWRRHVSPALGTLWCVRHWPWLNHPKIRCTAKPLILQQWYAMNSLKMEHDVDLTKMWIWWACVCFLTTKHMFSVRSFRPHWLCEGIPLPQAAGPMRSIKKQTAGNFTDKTWKINLYGFVQNGGYLF